MSRVCIFPSHVLLRVSRILCYYYFISGGLKAQKSFVTSRYVFLDKKTLFKILLNPGLNLTICRGTGTRTSLTWGVKRLVVQFILLNYLFVNVRKRRTPGYFSFKSKGPCTLGTRRFFSRVTRSLRRPWAGDTRTGHRKASGTQGKVPVFMINNL